MQSYWSALQFAPTNLPVFYRGMPQASHGNTTTNVTVPLRDGFSRNKETETKKKRANNEDQRTKHEISQY